MSLETDKRSRDYLYGRLLAVAECIEEKAMPSSNGDVRSTQASRLMQRFADRPAATWPTLERSLVPYQQRLRARNFRLEEGLKRLLDDICYLFTHADFISTDKLGGEYLLGFHCQRRWLRDHQYKDGAWIVRDANNKPPIDKQGDADDLTQS